MKPRIHLAVLCLQLCACADSIQFYDKNGHLLASAHLMSDRVNEVLTAPGGYSYRADSVSISTVTRANWHGAGLLGSEIVAGAIGWHTPSIGTAALAALPAATTAYRTTAPVATPAAKLAHP